MLLYQKNKFLVALPFFFFIFYIVVLEILHGMKEKRVLEYLARRKILVEATDGLYGILFSYLLTHSLFDEKIRQSAAQVVFRARLGDTKPTSRHKKNVLFPYFLETGLAKNRAACAPTSRPPKN